MRRAHVGTVKRTPATRGAPDRAIKMIVPILERAGARSSRTAKWWVLSWGGEPVASIRPAQKIRAIAAGDDVVWAFDQDDADGSLGVRYRVVEVRSASA